MRFLLAAMLAATLAVPALATESSDGTQLNIQAAITDSGANQWTFGASHDAYHNELIYEGSTNHSWGGLLAYHSHTVYTAQNNSTGVNWYYWNGTGWILTSALAASANATQVTSTDGAIIDASGNVWTLTTGTGNQVTKDGTQQGTADVVLMYYDAVNNRIYQENDAGAWWYTSTSGTVSWVATTDPRTSSNCGGTTFCDDFNGASLNADQHMASTSTWGYAGPDNTTWDGYNVNNAWMINPLHTGTTGTTFSNLYKLDGSGDLVLGIDNTPGTCTTACGNKSWISGQLIATQTFTQGHYIEARAKMSATPGTNFAIWLYDDHSGSGGVYQELDIVEAVRANDNSWTVAAQTIHHDPSANESWDQFNTTPFDLTAWHTYGVDWETGSICFYIDRVQTGCATSGVSSYTGSMHLWLSSQGAAGPPNAWGGPLLSGVTMPASMTIDYVRSYDHKPF